ncbi:MAG: SiaC family regulatory phosphoprotein, partial [Bacteroidales bacterium]|nr:SiaC family regulatory phosphoprotein [Bacteroidales bacterium]
TEIEFNLDYYNSSTSRIIVKLLIETEKIHNKTSNVHILWFYRANDEVMKNRGLELKSVVNLPFDMVEK